MTTILHLKAKLVLTIWRQKRPLHGSYRTANLQKLHFIYLFNKYTYWIF